MAITFKTSQIAALFANQTAKNLPILMNANRQFEDKFVAGNGTTIDIALPDYGTVTDGATINASTDLNYSAGSVPLSLTQKKVAFGGDQVTVAHDIEDFNEQVVTPFSNNLANQIEKGVGENLVTKASTALVVSASTPFGSLADGIARIRDSYSYGQLFGALNPKLSAKVAQTGLNLFNPTSAISEIFNSVAVGSFGGADFYHTANIRDLDLSVTGADLGAGAVSADVTEGATTIALKTLTGSKILAGTPFTIAGVYSLDVYGNSTGVLKQFVALADATVTSGAATVTVAKIITTGPSANCSKLPEKDDVSAAVLTAHKWMRGAIYDKQSLVFGLASLADIAGTESKTITDPQGLSLRVTRGPDIMNGREIVRVDALTGSAVIRPEWAVSLYLKA